jgi:hypothetical protein
MFAFFRGVFCGFQFVKDEFWQLVEELLAFSVRLDLLHE